MLSINNEIKILNNKRKALGLSYYDLAEYSYIWDGKIVHDIFAQSVKITDFDLRHLNGLIYRVYDIHIKKLESAFRGENK